MLPLLLSFPLALAASPGWHLSPDTPPLALSADRYRFAEGVDLQVLPGVVLALEPGAAAPAGAVSLGGRSWRLPVASPQAAVQAALDLTGTPGVAAVWPDVRLPQHSTEAAVDFDDPHYEGQWYLEELGMPELYAESLGDPGLRVAVIDSGIAIHHPDLEAGVADPYDAWSDDDDPSPDPGEYCYGSSTTAICDEHGTAVSGIVAARANNGVDIVGLCPACTLVPIKLLGEGSGDSLAADVAAFEHAIAADVGVINNSWGFTASIPVPAPLAEVIRRAATEPRGGLGAVVVFAAGNDDREIDDDEMQAMPEVLCVSATDRYGQPTAYTNSGASVDVAAPSATVTISPDEELLTSFGGTSAAAPVVSGLAAWALSVRPDLSAAELRALLVETAMPSPLVTFDADGHHPVYGYGELDALALKDALLGADGQDTGLSTGDDAGCGAGCATTQRAPGAGLLAGLLALVVASARRRKRLS